MIFSGSAVQTKGFGSSLVSRRKRLIAAWRSTIEQNAPRLRRRLVSLAKKPSTPLSQEQEVGVKWKTKRGWRASQASTFGCLTPMLRGISLEKRGFLRRMGFMEGTP